METTNGIWARTIYPSSEKPHTRYATDMRGPTFILVTHFTPKMKLETFPSEWDKISPLRFEGNFTKHVRDGVRIICTLPWHDENITNAVLSHKTLY